jgi:hypothetical protein
MRAGIIEQFSTFELLAELGLGLAGFGGVAAAFGGRSRDYGSTDLVRIRALFFFAGSVVAGSLAILMLTSYGLDDATSFLVTSAALALITGAAAVPLLLASYRIVRDPKTGAPAWLFFAGTIYFVVVEAFYVLNVFKGGEASPLIAAFSLSLVYGLWMFSRLVVRPNW